MKYSKLPLQNFSIWKKMNRDEISYYAKIIYLYLFSNSLTSMSGIFELPDLRKTGLNEDLINKGLYELGNLHLISIDEENELIAVYEMIKINRPSGIKQEKGILKNYSDIEEYHHWDKILDYMIKIEYNPSIIDFIKEVKLKIDVPVIKRDTPKQVEAVIPKENQEERKKEEELIEEKLKRKQEERKQKEEPVFDYKPEENQKELKKVESNIDSTMKDSKEILSLYFDKSEKAGNERDSLEYIYELLNKFSKEEMINAIERYISSLSEIKFSQKSDNFFKSSGNIHPFLKNPNKGIKKVKDAVKNSYSDYKSVSTPISETPQASNIPIEVQMIPSLSIKDIFKQNKGSEFLLFIRERSNWEFEDSDYYDILASRLIQTDALAQKFLKL